jgi:hypothetical protein
MRLGMFERLLIVPALVLVRAGSDLYAGMGRIFERKLVRAAGSRVSGTFHYGIVHSGCLSNSVRSPVKSNVLDAGIPVRNGVNSMETAGAFNRLCRKWIRSGSVLPT